MLQNNRVGFDWLTLFDLEEKETIWMVEGAKKAPSNEENIKYLCEFFITIAEVPNHDEIYVQACKKVLFNFCVNRTTFAKDMLSDEQYEKCVQLYNRRQFESKLLNELLSKFVCCLQYGQNSENLKKRINDLLRLDIIEEVENLTEQKVVKTFAPLKQQIEKIAGGVKSCCYLDAEKESSQYIFNVSIDECLNNFIIKKYSYDFNVINYLNNINVLTIYDNRESRVNKIFQYALYNDEKFWNEHNIFNAFKFLDVIIAANDYRHAEKVIDFMFQAICNSKEGEIIVKNKLPLVFLFKEEFCNKLQERTFKFTFERFQGIYDLRQIENCKLCYPISQINNINEILAKGKSLTEEFFKSVYPDNYEEVVQLLQNEISTPTYAFCGRQQSLVHIDTIESENSHSASLQKDEWTIKNVFDSCTFGYHFNIEDTRAVESYVPDYFSLDNIWNRFYIKMFYMEQISRSKTICFANMFEVFYDLFQFIEKITSIKTSYQRNTKGRDKSFKELKSLLEKFNVTISEENKLDYIVALLDRKVAVREESALFPVLEQLGDAIYGLAVAEMLFYNPKIDDISSLYNEYITANKQVQIAEKIGFDKLYMSSYSLPRKYEWDLLLDPDKVEIYVLQEERGTFSKTKKYIADSLEMVLGAICKDCGYQTAIKFSKDIIRKAFPNDFPIEVHWGDGNVLPPKERYHYTKILPALYSMLDYEVGDVYPDYQTILKEAFDKFYKAYVLGTEEKSVRNYITKSFRDNSIYDDCPFSEIDKVFYEYLHNGVKSSINKYGDSVKKRYQEIQLNK